MAIYDFSKSDEHELNTSPLPQNREYQDDLFDEPQPLQATPPKRDRFFSAFAARLFFGLLLIGNVVWACYAITRFLFCMLGRLLTGGKSFVSAGEKAWISLRRSLVCGVSLFITLFSPALGIMIACTYFLMYDKSGIEEVVPSSLQSQFKEFFPKE
jgi:hypothetical protein